MSYENGEENTATLPVHNQTIYIRNLNEKVRKDGCHHLLIHYHI